MKSLVEEKYDREKIIEEMRRSAQDLARDLALKDTIKMLRNYGLDNNTIAQMCQQGKDRNKVLKMLNEE